MALRTILLGICLFASAGNAQPPQVKVWAVVSGSQKIYHCPKSKWYRVETGREISECEAIGEGYKPAIGDGCGSDCKQH
jgi:hypothetical protein